MSHTTRTGKSTKDSESSDFYVTGQTTPPKALLKIENRDYTDAEGRSFWNTAKVDWEWEKLKEIQSSSGFDEKTDIVYFMRNPPKISFLELAPPEISLQTPVFFSDKKGAKWQAFIKDNGNDEIQMAMISKTGKRREKTSSGMNPRVRQTSFVVLSQLKLLY